MTLRHLKHVPANNTVLFPSVRGVHHLGFPAGSVLPHQQGAGWEAGQVQLYASSNASILSCCTESTQYKKGALHTQTPLSFIRKSADKQSTWGNLCLWQHQQRSQSLFDLCGRLVLVPLWRALLARTFTGPRKVSPGWLEQPHLTMLWHGIAAVIGLRLFSATNLLSLWTWQLCTWWKHIPCIGFRPRYCLHNLVKSGGYLLLFEVTFSDASSPSPTSGSASAFW